MPDALSEPEWREQRTDELTVLGKFTERQIIELAANSGKGDRPGWMAMSRKDLVAEIFWHAAKLAVAAKEADCPRCRGRGEFDEGRGGRLCNACGGTGVNPGEGVQERVAELAADVGNQAMMLADRLGSL